jgi:hypothetical protein
MPQYKCKNIAALDIALSGLPPKIRDEADAGTGVSAKTVGELRKVTAWSENLVNNNAAGTPSRKHSRNQQGYLSDSRLVETVGHGIKALGSVNRESVRAQCVTKATSGHASWLHCMSLRFGETGKTFWSQ